ncbi:MAG: hypothetical protein ABH826_05230 [Patescibacteria group bacterium]|nr:thrombospondin type 3 repeat-containing protein [Patescibacteria group bacterium]
MDEEDRKRVTIRKRNSGFASREQRAGFALIAVTGGLAFLLGAFYLVRQLNQPFDINYEGPQFVSSSDQRAAEAELQRTIDTDSDGLVDYDELYIYGTSPYLNDSDGDGFLDAQELAAGKDPLCAEGDNCFSSLYNPLANSTDDSGSLIDYAENTSNTSTQNFLELQEAVKQLNAEQVRQLLLDSGADQATVEQLTDEELLAVYQQVIADMESSGELSTLLDTSAETAPNPIQ